MYDTELTTVHWPLSSLKRGFVSIMTIFYCISVRRLCWVDNNESLYECCYQASPTDTLLTNATNVLYYRGATTPTQLELFSQNSLKLNFEFPKIPLFITCSSEPSNEPMGKIRTNSNKTHFPAKRLVRFQLRLCLLGRTRCIVLSLTSKSFVI